METADQEIRREKVLIPSEMTRKEIIAKYGVSPSCAFTARKKGWLIKNYSRNQVIIDRKHFHPEICYSIADLPPEHVPHLELEFCHFFISQCKYASGAGGR